MTATGSHSGLGPGIDWAGLANNLGSAFNGGTNDPEGSSNSNVNEPGTSTTSSSNGPNASSNSNSNNLGASSNSNSTNLSASPESSVNNNGADDASQHKRSEHLQEANLREEGVLPKRQNNIKSISVLGTCTLAKPGTPAATTYITIPTYPAASSLEQYSGAVWWYVPSTAAVRGSYPTVTVKKFSDKSVLTATPVMTAVSQSASAPAPYNLGGRKTPLVNVDHVYELKFLKEFFAEMLKSQLSCADLNSFFMATDTANGREPRLQTLWNQLPSSQNPDFAGMDSVLNNYKGVALGTGSYQKFQSDADKLQFLNMLAASIYTTNLPEVAALFQKTNQRLHSAFLGIDQLVAKQQSQKKAAPVPKTNKGWADAYSSYMSSRLASANSAVSQTIGQMASSLSASPASPTGNSNGIRKGENHRLFIEGQWVLLSDLKDRFDRDLGALLI
ncbi:MAG: hypothetical protein M1822_007666 [Bathelium mastoideum]|nr:MAG: hypothetical protein M1822_007666 [Bathelium mastoideum]